ncbi:MAG: hypothetical protein ACD_28C00395G0001 [uncultured bacterium]|nr:MAG: hypothetical protein ACD_28C00395G0001 [uncultured bacterium]KKT74302.1 MAG: hypothetical protein UW70_C0059G0003 [Candidatus Peregrinibacteria bacterium GW2011_GWA2_44_7]
MPSLSYLAILMGSMILLSRVPGIFYPKEFAKVVKKFLSDSNIRFFAVVPLWLSVSILLQKNDFTPDLETIMSVLGWLMLLGTVMIAWWPSILEERVERVLKSESMTSFLTFLGSLVGVGFLYLGFYVYS